MVDILAFLSNAVTIATGVIGVAFFLYRHISHSWSTLSQNPANSASQSISLQSSAGSAAQSTSSQSSGSAQGTIPTSSQSSAGSTSRFSLRVTRAGLILFSIIIITGAVSGYLLLLPGIMVKQHQDFYNQQVTQPTTYFSTLKNNADQKWQTGQPQANGNGGQCLFTGEVFAITVTVSDYFYPCYMANSYQNFVMQVQMQITSGDAGGIIFRDNSNRPDFYYLSLTTTGTYTLTYWADNTGNKVTALMEGTNSEFYSDQVHGRSSTVAIAAQDAQFSLYIDGIYVDSAQDTRISSGRIALAAQMVLNKTEVAYRQIQIWAI